MQKYPLIGASIAVVCLIILASFSNVVGVKSVESSDDIVIKDEVDHKDQLFQTIVDLANNKEIQKAIKNSNIKENLEKSLEIPGSKLLMLELRLRFLMVLPPPPVLTKNYLDYAYKVSERRLKNFDESRITPILENFQVTNQEIQNEIYTIIEKDAILKAEITQLSNLNCDCENINTTMWRFPVICIILYPIAFVILTLYYFSWVLIHYISPQLQNLFDTIVYLGTTFNCFWAVP